MEIEPSVSVESRRLGSTTPAWSDFLVIVGLCAILMALLYFLLKMSAQWQRAMAERIRVAKEKRRVKNDNFREENGYSWDIVFVFEVYKENDRLTAAQSKYSLKRLLRELADGGLQTRLFYSVQADEVYCKVRVPLHRLEKEADRVDMKLKLDPIKLKELCKEGRPGLWPPVTIPDECVETPYSPYDYIYAKYECDRPDVADLYQRYENGTVFRGVDRLKLIYGIIAAKKYEGGCNLDIYKLLQQKCMIGFFPLHDHVELRTLEEKWLQFFQFPWNQPVDDIKNYMGEKIGLYFLWLGHYTSWLIVAAVVGFFAWINVATEGNDPNAAVMPYFAAFMGFWSTLFLEFWKRKENLYAMKWGMEGFEEEEQPRPQFIGEKRPSPVTGKPYLYFPRNEEQQRLFQSSIVISGFICIVIGAVVAIFIIKLTLSQIKSLTLGEMQLGSTIAAILNAIQIQVMNMIYGDIAIKLNDYENHRTDTKYEDALISKTFVFQFVNSYASLFYIAFVKPFIPTLDPCIDSCMQELQTNLGTIFLTRLAIGNFTEVLVPYIQSYLKEREGTKGATAELSEVEKTFYQPEYHVMLGTFDDFAEMMIQFGYTTMFVAAFPLATVMSFVNNYIEIRVDAWKLCQVCRRAEPRSAEDIGTWHGILEIMSLFAVITNAALVAFTGTYTDDYRWVVRVWIFICFAGGIITINALIAIAVPDVPPEVDIQLKRQEYLVGKVLDNIQDEDEEGLTQGLSTKVDYTVLETDNDPL